MALVLGLNAKLYRNTGSYGSPTWDLIPNVMDLALNMDAGEATASNRGSTWELTVATLKKASLEFKQVWDPADLDVTTLLGIFTANSTIEMLVLDGLAATTGSQGLRALMMVTAWNREEPLEGALLAALTMKPTYSANAPAWYTVP